MVVFHTWHQVAKSSLKRICVLSWCPYLLCTRMCWTPRSLQYKSLYYTSTALSEHFASIWYIDINRAGHNQSPCPSPKSLGGTHHDAHPSLCSFPDLICHLSMMNHGKQQDSFQLSNVQCEIQVIASLFLPSRRKRKKLFLRPHKQPERLKKKKSERGGQGPFKMATGFVALRLETYAHLRNNSNWTTWNWLLGKDA